MLGPFGAVLVIIAIMVIIVTIMILTIYINVNNEKKETLYRIMSEVMVQLPVEELKKLKILKASDDTYNVRQDIDDIRRRILEKK